MQASRDWTWSTPLVIAGGVLALLALGKLIIGLEAIGESQQLDYGEPIVYSHAMRLVAGAPLYQPFENQSLTTAAYTPLYYTLAAGLYAVFGTGFGPGRALSYAAGVAASLVVARLAARHTRSVWAGVFAALLFLGLGFPGIVPWFAVYRVDVLAAALSLGAIAVIADGMSAKQLVVAGLLAGMALLTKQSYAAALLAGTVWLWSVGSRRRALLFGGTAAVLALVVAAAEELATHAFFDSAVLANANPANFEQFSALATMFGATLGLPIAVACLYVVLARAWSAASRGRLLLFYWAASALPLVGLVKVGASYNYWIEFAASTAILATSGLWTVKTWQPAPARFIAQAFAWLFAINMAVLAPASAAAAASAFSTRATLTGLQPTTTAEFQALVEFVRAVPGPVLADPLDVVVLGGRSVLLEPVLFGILERQGQWDPNPLAGRICAGEIHLLVLAFPMDAVARYAPYGEPWWPPRVMQALQDCMQPVGQRAGRFLYAPRGRD